MMVLIVSYCNVDNFWFVSKCVCVCVWKGYIFNTFSRKEHHFSLFFCFTFFLSKKFFFIFLSFAKWIFVSCPFFSFSFLCLIPIHFFFSLSNLSLLLVRSSKSSFFSFVYIILFQNVICQQCRKKNFNNIYLYFYCVYLTFFFLVLTILKKKLFYLM